MKSFVSDSHLMRENNPTMSMVSEYNSLWRLCLMAGSAESASGWSDQSQQRSGTGWCLPGPPARSCSVECSVNTHTHKEKNRLVTTGAQHEDNHHAHVEICCIAESRFHWNSCHPGMDLIQQESNFSAGSHQVMCNEENKKSKSQAHDINNNSCTERKKIPRKVNFFFQIPSLIPK